MSLCAGPLMPVALWATQIRRRKIARQEPILSFRVLVSESSRLVDPPREARGNGQRSSQCSSWLVPVGSGLVSMVRDYTYGQVTRFDG